jgi:hypothetical protein
VGRRLTNIEGVLKRFMESQQFEREVIESVERLKSGIYPALTLIEDGKVLAEVCHEKFIQEKGMEKWFRVAATPLNPKGSLLNVDDPGIRSLVESPPQSRYGGWNMVTGDMAIFHIEVCGRNTPGTQRFRLSRIAFQRAYGILESFG